MGQRNLFHDSEKYDQFEVDGYVTIDLFTDNELDHISSIFHHYFPTTPPAFFSSSYLSDFKLKLEISQKIEAIMVPKLEQHFKDFRCIGAAFLSKAADEHSTLPMHQDWTIVDETKYLAANIWTPITSPSNTNGTLEVLPGSHKTFRTLRAPTVPFSGNNLRDEIKPHLVSLYPKRGEAVILDQALVHYSSMNRSKEPRLAFTTGLISQNAALHFHYWDKTTGELEKFAMEDDFLFRWKKFHEDIFKRPTFGTSMGKQAFEPTLFNHEDLKKTLPIESQASAFTKQGHPSLLRRLKEKWFNT